LIAGIDETGMKGYSGQLDILKIQRSNDVMRSMATMANAMAMQMAYGAYGKDPVMQAQIKRASQAVEFWTEERCFITETANDNGDEAVSIARARVQPGVTTAWHRLEGVTERYIIVSGQGRVEIGTAPPEAVGPGDVVRIPAEVPQRITNTGSGDLIFFAVCCPPFQRQCYIGLE
jgi:mannose-6-phosphate isomerase-like protein (cupin superfamily)